MPAPGRTSASTWTCSRRTERRRQRGSPRLRGGERSAARAERKRGAQHRMAGPAPLISTRPSCRPEPRRRCLRSTAIPPQKAGLGAPPRVLHQHADLLCGAHARPPVSVPHDRYSRFRALLTAAGISRPLPSPSPAPTPSRAIPGPSTPTPASPPRHASLTGPSSHARGCWSHIHTRAPRSGRHGCIVDVRTRSATGRT